MVKDDCIFCKIANGTIPSETLFEDETIRCIFDIAPASKGHLLIIPKQHFKNIYELDKDTAGHAFAAAANAADALNEALNPEGLNVVQNNGEAAGQTVMHFHIHLIPRYKGDGVNIGWKPGELSQDEVKRLNACVKKFLPK